MPLAAGVTATARMDDPRGDRGLSASDCEELLRWHGPNELAGSAGPGAAKILVRQFKSPFIYVLLGAAFLSLYLGKQFEAVVIFLILAANAAIGFAQEFRAEQSLKALGKLTEASCRVRRDGRILSIHASGVVPGDVLELSAGDRVPADSRILSAVGLQCDESLLTGESVAVDKVPGLTPSGASLAERQAEVFAGTIVAAGRGRALVTATGMSTQLGKIVEISRSASEELPLTRELARLSRTIIALVVGFLALLLAVALLAGAAPGVVVLTVISMAVAVIPEGLPIAMVVGLSVSVWRMARLNVLVRRIPAVEGLGAVTFVCTDKTGTLTKGEMQVAGAFIGGRHYNAAALGPQRRLLAADGGIDDIDLSSSRSFSIEDPLGLGLGTAAICCDADIDAETSTASKNPTESALLVAAENAGVDWRAIHEGAVRLAEMPFSSSAKIMAVHVRLADGRRFVAAKGAPERLIAQCTRVLLPHGIGGMDQVGKSEFTRRLDEFGRAGFRVIGLACDPEPAAEETGAGSETFSTRLVFLGLVALRDPPRPGVREAVERCHDAGVSVAMLTGDSAPTAEAIAHEVGILDARRHPVISGPEIDRMDDETLKANVAVARVFARVAPEHKLRIVKALQDRGEVVAMTGDGVNDMPALKAADVGVAMGKRGTEAAKEAADVVLADDEFHTIVDGVEEGRRIRDNLDRVLFFLLSASFAEMLFLGLGFVVMLFAFGVGQAPLNPVQILWVNLGTGALIAVPLMLERAEPDSMTRGPRNPKEGLLSPRLFIRILLACFCIALASSVLFLAFHVGGDPARASTLAFAVIMVAEWFTALSARSLSRPSLSVGLLGNRWLLAAIGAGILLCLMSIQLPALQPVFGTVSLSLSDWGLVIALGSTPFWTLESYKSLTSRPSRRERTESLPVVPRVDSGRG